MARSLVRLGGTGVIAHPVALARNPKATMKAEPVGSIVLLVTAIAALHYVKTRSTPTFGELAKYAGVGLGFIVVGSFAPDPVLYILGIVLLVWVLQNEPAFSEFFQSIVHAIPQS